MQVWKSLGLIFDVKQINHSKDWMWEYAAVPFIEFINDNTWKIYFSTRNKSNKSLIGWLICSFEKEKIQIQKISSKPLLPLGEIGEFDEDGVMGCHILKHKDKKILYYIGWNRGVSVPFRNAIGIAIEDENGNFHKPFKGPIIDRSPYDPCFVASNCIIKKQETLIMYYLSADKWILKNNGLRHYYNIKIAYSNDGIHWNRKGEVAIDYKYPNEYAISVPRVIKDNEKYKMWYSYRGGLKSENYYIGYAESTDAIHWERKDEEVYFIRSGKWDSEMICYPFVFDHKGKRYMLYNGNGYGKTGFGLAVLEEG